MPGSRHSRSSCNAPPLSLVGQDWRGTHSGNEINSMTRPDNIVRRQLLKAGLIVAGVEFCPEALFDRRAAADDKKEMPIGAREIVKGVDGMSWDAEKGGTVGLGHDAG